MSIGKTNCDLGGRRRKDDLTRIYNDGLDASGLRYDRHSLTFEMIES